MNGTFINLFKPLYGKKYVELYSYEILAFIWTYKYIYMYNLKYMYIYKYLNIYIGTTNAHTSVYL